MYEYKIHAFRDIIIVMIKAIRKNILYIIIQAIITLSLVSISEFDRYSFLGESSILTIILLLNSIFYIKDIKIGYSNFIKLITIPLLLNYIIVYINVYNSIEYSIYTNNIIIFIIFIFLNIIINTILFNLKKHINISFIYVFFTFTLFLFIFNNLFNIYINDVSFYINISFILGISSIAFLPKNIRLIVYSLLFFIMFIYVNGQYMHFNILDDMFSIFDIYHVEEASDYLSVINDHIKFKLILFDIVLLLVYAITIIELKKLTYIYNNNAFSLLIFSAIILRILSFVLIHYSDEARFISSYLNTVSLKNSISNIDGRYDYSNNFGIYQYIYCDIKSFIFNTDNEGVDSLIAYVNNKEPNKDNEYTNILKDENIIFILGETIDNWVVSDAMPTLNYMINDGINFSNYFASHYNGGRTLNSEYTINTGFYIPSSYNVYESIYNNYDYSFAQLFNNNGYKTTYIHSNDGEFYARDKLTKSYGYDNSYFLEDMYNTTKYFDDRKLLEDDIYDLYFDKDNKFMSFVTTYSGHGGYIGNKYCKAHNIKKEYDCYSHLVTYTDDFISGLIKRLEEDNLLDNTTIVLVGDHYAYLYKDTKYLKDRKDANELTYNIDKVPFVIWNNRINKTDIDKICDIDDVLPTLANMVGLKYDSRFYMGDDVLSDTFKEYLIRKDKSLVCYDCDAVGEYAYNAKDYGSNVIKNDFSLYKLNMIK